MKLPNLDAHFKVAPRRHEDWKAGSTCLGIELRSFWPSCHFVTFQPTDHQNASAHIECDNYKFHFKTKVSEQVILNCMNLFEVALDSFISRSTRRTSHFTRTPIKNKHKKQTYNKVMSKGTKCKLKIENDGKCNKNRKCRMNALTWLRSGNPVVRFGGLQWVVLPPRWQSIVMFLSASDNDSFNSKYRIRSFSASASTTLNALTSWTSAKRINISHITTELRPITKWNAFISNFVEFNRPIAS